MPLDALIAVPHPVRLHRLLPHRLPGDDHRARRLSGRARGGLAAHRRGGLLHPLPVLVEAVRARLRHRRRHRAGAVLRVRHQLEPLLGRGRQRDRAPDGLRGAERLLPRGGLSRDHAVRLERVGRRLHFLATCMVVARHPDLDDLDPLGQQLDAHACRLRDGRRGVPRHRLVGGDLQSFLPLPARAHGHGRVLERRHGRGRRLGLVPAAAAAPRLRAEGLLAGACGWWRWRRRCRW